MFRAFGLFLCLVVMTATVIQATMQVSLNVGQRPYSVTFDENNFTILSLAEKFCRDLAGEFDLRTMEALLLNCMSPVARELRAQISTKMDPTKIAQGSLTPDAERWLAAANAAAVSAERARAAKQAAEAPVNPAQLPTDFRVAVNAGGQQLVILIDLNRFSLTSAAENFCRQRAELLGITTYQMLVDECIPQVL
jgi:hypothetical protein